MLKGKTAIITGAGRGIGRAIAVRLAEGGANVVAVARSARELDETRRVVERHGGACLAVSADVTQADSVDRLVDDAMRSFRRVDILVNNAGVAPLAPLTALEPEQFDALIAINIRAVYLCCRAVWPKLAVHGGSIVNISSVAADDPFPGFSAYGGTKAFVNTFSRALDAEGAPQGIRVFCVAPGAVETQMLRGPFPDFPSEKTLDPDAVAALVETLLQSNGVYLAGQPIRIRKT